MGDASSGAHTGLILLVHGDVDPRWDKPFVCLQERLIETMGRNRVYLAYLYHQSPSLLEAAIKAHTVKVRDVVVLPLFLALGGKTEIDIPRQVVKVKEKLPELNITLLPPIGEHPVISEEIYACALKAVNLKDKS